MAAWRARICTRRDGYYYLMAAEGGTGFGHGVTLARSAQINGPYEPGPVNPFLTSNPAPYFGRNDHDYLRPHLYNPHAELQKVGTRLAGGNTVRRVVRRPPLRATPRSRNGRRCSAARPRSNRSSRTPTTLRFRSAAAASLWRGFRTPAPQGFGQ